MPEAPGPGPIKLNSEARVAGAGMKGSKQSLEGLAAKVQRGQGSQNLKLDSSGMESGSLKKKMSK